ncbi:MAG TPA: MBL fold metallo-hydrolase [Gammaproteobacteria bacterium]|nr:MBL fold metallo-hydrolase [Gammaproteobacteria bacterium]
MKMRRVILAALAAAAALPLAYRADAQVPTFITLGTHGGPLPDAKRSQPANALVVDRAVYLVDVGDGAAEQLAKAGLSLQAVRAVFISHLHFDHTGGLFGVLGLRQQTNSLAKLTIYGPPGTKETVTALLAAAKPGGISGYGVPGERFIPPDVEAIEIRDGAHVSLDGFTVTAVENTHYSFPRGSDLDQRFDSLSFRFDFPGRSIVYTGDTGPSDAVTALAKGADILVSELIDAQVAASGLGGPPPANAAGAQNRAAPAPPPPPANGAGAKSTAEVMREHLSAHHVTPEQVGRMAADAKVGRVVITHLVASRRPDFAIDSYVDEIRKVYSGPVVIANDLDRF